MKARTLLTLMVAALHYTYSSAQSEEMMGSISQQLEAMVDAHLKNRLLSHEFSTDTTWLSTLFQFADQDSSERKLAQAVHEAQITQFSRDKGVGFRANYANSIGESIIEDDGSFYNWRIQAGLDWNIFRDGFVSKQHRIKEAELNWAAKQNELDRLASKRNYRANFDFIIYAFNQKKISLIQERLVLLDQLRDINNQLFYLKFTPWEDVLDLMSKRTETELFLKNFETYVKTVQLDSARSNQTIGALPIFNLDLQKIQEVGTDTVAEYQELTHKLAALDHNYHWSKDISLNAQLRYNYYDGSVTSQFSGRDFFTAGISVGMPIPFNRASTKSLVQSKKDQLEGDYRTYRRGIENELLTHFYEYQYTLKQFVHFFYKKERIAVLIKRNLSQRNLQDPNYSPVQVVDRLDEIFSVDLELLDIQQKLYLKALKIFQLIGAKSTLPFIDILDYSHGAKRFTAGTSISIDNEDFGDLAVNFLIEYLQYNDLREILVNADSQPDLYIKYAELLDAVKEESLDMQIRFSLQPLQYSTDGIKGLLSDADFALTPYLHLDLGGLPTGGSQQNDFISTDIITVVKTLAVSHDVSVSLPIKGTEALRKSLYPLVSMIYFLPEESDDLVGLVQLINGQTGEDPGKIRLSIRPHDFSTRLEMDNFSKELKNHLNVENVSISSLGEMLQLERQTVGWHEERGF